MKAGKFAEEDGDVIDDDDTMDSLAGSSSGVSSGQPTSNLVLILTNTNFSIFTHICKTFSQIRVKFLTNL
jgi:hypothetical protein